MIQALAVETKPVVAGWHTGDELLTCVGTRDFDRLAACFHPRVICRLLVPSGLLTPRDLPALMGYYRQWFAVADRFDMEASQITHVGETLHVGYRIRLREEGAWYVVEQQTFSQLEGDSIVRFDLMCSGFHLDEAAT